MRLKSIITRLSRRRSGVALLLGVSTMLTGVERLLAPSRQKPPDPSLPFNSPEAARKSRTRVNYFAIRQTRSEIGLVYWVLQGFGCYQSFTLFDTWQEAVEEANRRLAGSSLPATVLEPEYAKG